MRGLLECDLMETLSIPTPPESENDHVEIDTVEIDNMELVDKDPVLSSVVM